MKKIALVGSSGGNLYRLGGQNFEEMITCFEKELEGSEYVFEEICFLMCDGSLDLANTSANASIYIHKDEIYFTGTLSECNEKLLDINKKIADKILHQEIDALFLLSCDPENTNQAVIEAAVKTQIPVCGTGGSSMASVKAKGANVIYASGTTGSTNLSRAMNMTGALLQRKEKDEIHFSIENVLMKTLPFFVITTAFNLLNIKGLTGYDQYIPMLVALFSVLELCDNETGLLPGILIGLGLMSGNIITSLLFGFIAGYVLHKVKNRITKTDMPASFSTIFMIFIAAVFFVFYKYITIEAVKPVILLYNVYDMILNQYGIFIGSIAGILIWKALRKGFYHLIYIPLIFIELEMYGYSLLGAIDFVCLVMFSAAILFSKILQNRNNYKFVKEGIKQNLLYGTFVEASYPYIHKGIHTYSLYILSAITGGALGYYKIKSVAYLPCFAAFLLSSNPLKLIMITIISMIILCIISYFMKGNTNDSK